jgi:hypothetical protein
VGVAADEGPESSSAAAVWSVEPEGTELADDCWVAVVQEQRGAVVHRGDARHVVVGEGEVEDVDVLGHPFGSDGLGDDDDAALDEPPQHDLSDGLAARDPDLAERRVGEEAVASLREGSPKDSICTPRSRISVW